MRRYLIVANQTLAAEPLVSRMRELARAAPSSFHVVVPATPPRDHSGPRARPGQPPARAWTRPWPGSPSSRAEVEGRGR